MTDRYEDISTIYISLSDLENAYLKKERKLSEYRRVGIDFGGKRLNLSSIVYGKIVKTKGRKKISVLPESYQERNIVVIDSIIAIVLHARQKGSSPNTIYGDVKSMMYFWDWLREEGEILPWSIEEARVLYEKYTIYLKQRMRIYGKNGIASGTAHSLQRSAKNLLQEIFDDQENIISSFIRAIPATSKKREALVPQDEEVEYAFNFYYKFFDQVADFLLDGGNFPFRLDFPSETQWVLPYRTKWIHMSHWNNNHKVLAFNYKTGSFLNEKELLDASSYINEKSVWKILNTRKKLLSRLKDANLKKKNHEDRLFLGAKAIKAYFMVMLALTGGNDKQIAMMPWSEEFEEKSEMQGFKTIKPRAKYKEVRFEIQSEFIGSFRKFLKLRDYVLQGGRFDYLFFNGHGKEAKIVTYQKTGVFGNYIFNSLFIKIDPNLSNVLSRKFRVYKTKWVLNKYGLWVASLMSQSSIPTVLKRYNGESPEEHFAQIQSFMDQMHSNIVTEQNEEYIETSVGGCASVYEPLQEFSDTPIKSDCSRPEGCLFCRHYRLHPDKEDIRKLLSLEYVLNEVTALNAQSAEHFERVMGAVLNRIEALVELLNGKGEYISSLVNEVRNDVYNNENLSYYWEQKMKSLYGLGAVR